MGIVVCIAMLLGVIMFMPKPWRPSTPVNKFILRIQQVTPVLLMAIGSWNCLWYGLRHIGSFWGLVAVVSGVTMVLAGLVLSTQSNAGEHGLKHTIQRILRAPRIPVFMVLLASFLLYLVTLIQLNLGYL